MYMVNAIILAGGFGTRLRPLSCTIPKPMLPVLNKPLLHFMISRMTSELGNKLEKIVIAVNYRANDIRAYMKNWQEKVNVEIHIVEEKHPLGTGGAVRYSKKILDGEDFFMLNGDVISFFSYNEMFDFHVKKQSEATISAIHVSDVSRYGVVVADDDNRILEFFEKPNTPELLSKYGIRPINAGTYLLDPSIFDLIPPDKKVSIEKEVFPKLVEQGKAFKFEFKGEWRDLGLPEDYLEGNFRILDRERHLQGKESLIDKSAEVSPKAKIIHPVCFGEHVKIGENCEVGPYVIVGNDTEIGAGVKLKESVLFENCIIDNFASLERLIMSEGVKVGRWVRIQGMGIISSNVSFDENVTLVATKDKPIKICPWKHITKDSLEAAASNGLFFH
ncbi:MAG: sugar phosphate nucleotidyltransferase [Promethearchaeota archaeon]